MIKISTRLIKLIKRAKRNNLMNLWKILKMIRISELTSIYTEMKQQLNSSSNKRNRIEENNLPSRQRKKIYKEENL
jgi:hypothetical protein